ncbi:unnamed protein product [Phytophthora fragariaefolia]|uniref:Unnamed protein product n=1 Tax=Phytophthora fragariaefolia TaxID=1490495 RepID=A0A9W6XTL4_9STRA|nr:unnamed protein product [Phytophthora fragariaefolia]
MYRIAVCIGQGSSYEFGARAGDALLVPGTLLLSDELLEQVAKDIALDLHEEAVADGDAEAAPEEEQQMKLADDQGGAGGAGANDQDEARVGNSTNVGGTSAERESTIADSAVGEHGREGDAASHGRNDCVGNDSTRRRRQFEVERVGHRPNESSKLWINQQDYERLWGAGRMRSSTDGSTDADELSTIIQPDAEDEADPM